MKDLHYTRQVRLPEVGEAGQARLAAATVAPSSASPDARAIEVAYLEAAGIGRIDLGTEGTSDRPVDVDALGLRDAAARAVGEGALRALVAMKEVLGA